MEITTNDKTQTQDHEMSADPCPRTRYKWFFKLYLFVYLYYFILHLSGLF